MVTLHQDERGQLNALLLPLVIVGVLFVGTAVFAYVAYSGMQDYKNNSDQKSAVAVSAALKKEDAKKEAEFAEASKSPLKSYLGPAAYGSVVVQYPKTWGAYINEQNDSGSSIDGYFNPNFVPSINSQNSTFGLRVKIISQQYASVIQTFQSSISIKKTTAAPYAFVKVPSVIGTRLTGSLVNGKDGTMIVVPLRDNTLEVWTEGTTATADFEKYILPNISFAP